MKRNLLFLAIILVSSTMNLVSAQSLNPSFMQGYNDGYNEGRTLALAGNSEQYDQFWRSYLSYPTRFPNHTQNFDYFRGKYVGILDGWFDYYTSSNNSGEGGTGGGGGGNGEDGGPSNSVPSSD